MGISSVLEANEHRWLSSDGSGFGFGFGSTVHGSVRWPAWIVMREVVFRAIFFLDFQKKKKTPRDVNIPATADMEGGKKSRT